MAEPTPMDPGKMRDRIEVWNQQMVTAPGGWEEEAWVHHRTIWCRARFESGREFVSNHSAGATTRVVFQTRYRSDIGQEDRIKFNGFWWDIKAVLPVGFKVGLDITAEAGSAVS